MMIDTPETETGHSENTNKRSDPARESSIEITCFTDPLCSWSWASEPSWFRLRNQFEERIQWHYVMGGLLPIFKPEQIKPVSKPSGGVFLQTSETRIPMRIDLWHTDPPSSSYPACIAVKCAALQSEKAGELYLNYAREAAMTKGLNISKTEILLLIAKTLAHDNSPFFDADRFEEDWKKGAGCDAFCQDLKITKEHHIERFPTLIMSHSGKENVVVTGYRPYSALLEAYKKAVS